MEVVAGIDSSTQSTKVELRRTDSGELVGAGRAPHPATSVAGVPGASQADPATWWTALGAATAAARTDAGPVEVVALAVAGQQHGLVALDDRGEVLHPALLWNDVRAAPQAAELVLGEGRHWWAQRCGSVPVAAFTVAKLAWLAAVDPDAIARLATVLLPHDWLTWRLTGSQVTDRGDASGTGWWSPRSAAYVPEALGAALTVGFEAAAARATAGAGAAPDPGRWPHPDDLALRLPRVLGPTEVAGHLTAEAADALGLEPGAVVAPGTGDNMAGALGTGLVTGDVAVSIGTSGTVYAVTAEPTADPSGAVAGFADAAGGYLPLVCTLNATGVTDAVARLLGVDHAGLDELARSAPTGADGLVLVPYLAGERTPDRPEATGTLAGIRTDVTRPALARAAVEGVVCGLLEGLDALRAAGVGADGRLVLVGGGSRSPAYRQVLADLAGRAVTVPAGDEHVARGACVQAAAVATGSDPTEVARRWRPDAAHEVVPEVGGEQAAAIRAAYAAARG